MTAHTGDHYEIVTEIRNLLLSTLDDVQPSQVVRDTQNFAALPENAIVIAPLFDQNLDVTSNTFEADKERGIVSQSVEMRVQISFYGRYAPDRSRIFGQLWANEYMFGRAKGFKPLYVQSRQRAPYVNESNQFEDRYLLDLALQYNPSVSYAQDFADEANIDIETFGG